MENKEQNAEQLRNKDMIKTLYGALIIVPLHLAIKVEEGFKAVWRKLRGR